MAKPRTKAGKKRKVETVMGEFKRKELRSSSGALVTDRDQAIAIALSEAGLSRKEKQAAKQSSPVKQVMPPKFMARGKLNRY